MVPNSSGIAVNVNSYPFGTFLSAGSAGSNVTFPLLPALIVTAYFSATAGVSVFLSSSLLLFPYACLQPTISP